MQKRNYGNLGGIAIIIIFLAAAGGWIANIVKAIHHINDPLTALEIFRLVGIICPPLGAILGWI